MNRNEVVEAMAKAIWDTDSLRPPNLMSLTWTGLLMLGKNQSIQLRINRARSQAEAALTALEAIMERDNVKMLDGYMPTAPTSRSAMIQEQQFKECFDQAKCKLRGE